ncbi:hypothetical protein HW561_02845 [Rhodobacteraceae bacterium B1Z28]|uniref:NnrT protein n=1 Tax=Ruegeria haliotis TaxID=2747601 RepID=A0ABX2PMB1_9RHOB|nr:hypothetical protein [Ruegeria haliotis]NVO54727.1 hypothetical protein [Ruegeria haliotis]
MSGTRSPSRKAPATDGKWPVWKLAILLYPATALTVAINLFLAGLIAHSAGFGVIGPVTAILWSVPLGIPASWLVGRWVRGLMDEAGG